MTKNRFANEVAPGFLSMMFDYIASEQDDLVQIIFHGENKSAPKIMRQLWNKFANTFSGDKALYLQLIKEVAMELYDLCSLKYTEDDLSRISDICVKRYIDLVNESDVFVLTQNH